MKSFYDGKTPPCGRREAFALIVALGLMSFIFLLILSLSTLVRLESQVGTTQSEQRLARQNALLGLQVAMGQLQEMAGPDQRVTGTAGLIDGMSEPQHANWTGVWDVSGRNPHAPFVTPATLGWLVSGTDNGGGSLEPGSAVRDSITIVGEGSVDDPDDQVQVGRVTISSDGSETGHFAYWVSDEGVKAKINLNDPHREAPSGDDAQKRYSLLSAQRNGIEAISSEAATDGKPLGDVIDPQDSAIQSQLTRLASVNQLGILNNSLDEVRKIRFHDLTTSSNGLLTNTANGGLKKDLTLAFEMGLSDFNGVNDFAGRESVRNLSSHQVNYLFAFDDFNEPSPVAADPLARGPTWHLLRNYYRLYKSDDPDRMQSYKPGNPPGVQPDGSGYKIVARPYYPVLPDNSSITSGYYYTGGDPVVSKQFFHSNGSTDLGRETDMPINPLVMRVMFVTSLIADKEEIKVGDETKYEYKLSMKLSPVVMIWNPYNVKLEYDGMAVRMVKIVFDASIDVSGDEYELKNLLDGRTITLELNVAGTLEPGEIRAYAMNESQDMSSDLTVQCSPSFESMASLPGILFHKLDVNNSQDNGQVLTVEDNDVLSITVGANSYVQSRMNLISPYGGSAASREVQGGYLTIKSSITWEAGIAMSTLDADGLLGQALPFANFDYYLKAASDDNPVQFLTHYNPRAATFRRSTGAANKLPLGEGFVNPGNWDFKAEVLTSMNNGALPVAGSWGDDKENGHTRVVLFDIPVQPMQSLAQLQHVNNVTHYAQQPAYPIGNSYANPFIGLEALSRTIVVNSSSYTQLDWSYLSNEALWDEYFFSTLVPRADLDMNDSDWNVFVTGFANGTYDLPNSRIRLLPEVAPETFVATVLGSATGDSIAADAYEKVAADLAVDGAFNVNSTSVEAWKALLSATNGLDVTYLSSSGGDMRIANSQSNPYSRLSLPDDNANGDWAGFRSLTDAQIQDLAEAIVEQVKERGPFVSLADFVNRRLADDDTGLKGPLQAAIDETNINNGFNYTVNSSDLSGATFAYPEHAVGPTESGATGYLRQADLLQTLGPVLTARSDTFVIRAYGDSVNPITGAEMRAWCEAVVQRIPDYVDDTDAANKSSNLSAINDRFGRRFEIVSFRWLSEDQI